MRIAIVTTNGINPEFKNWPEYIVGRYLVARGHRVTLYRYEPAGSAACETIDGVEVRFIPRGPAFRRALWRALDAEPRPDIGHIWHIRNLAAYDAGRWFQRAGIPFVHEPNGPLHDDYLVADRDRPLDSPPRFNRLIFTRARLAQALIRAEGRPRALLRNYRVHAPIRWARHVIAISRHEATLLRGYGVAEEQITYVPNWIDEAYHHSLPGAPPEAPWPRPVLLYIGQLKYRKGFDLLARAAPTVLERFPAASFVYAGHSPREYEALEAIAVAQGTRAHFHYVGRPDAPGLQQLYRAADALVFPSRYEGFGLPPLEAMAAGCPVITCAVPAVDEIVFDGENGLLAPYNDAAGLAATILRLLDQPELRRRIVAGGYRTVTDTFNGNELIERVLNLYRDVIASGPRGAT